MSNANKIVLAVVAVLVVATLALVVGSGSCSGRGGGGAAGGTTMQQGSSANANNTANIPVQGSQSASAGSFDYGPVSGAAKDMTIEEFEQLLASSSGPTGSNARDAAASTSVPTGAEVYNGLSQRGFDDVKVSVDFDMDGNYSAPVELDASSANRYPSYTVTYSSATGVLWILYVNDGAYFAAPLASSAGSLSKNMIFTETDNVIQYDGMKNEFSDFGLDQVPDTTCVKVDHIDKATLDSYSLDALEKAR